MPRYAAIDIGSNSIRMLAAETGHGMPTKILAAERQVTRLGAGVFQDGRITREAMGFRLRHSVPRWRRSTKSWTSSPCAP